MQINVLNIQKLIIQNKNNNNNDLRLFIISIYYMFLLKINMILTHFTRIF